MEAALTDRVTLRPQGEVVAEGLMREAVAAQWLSTAGYEVAESAYLDPWMCDIPGYERG